MTNTDADSPDARAQITLDAIMDRPNGDILNIMQAARELPGALEQRLTAAYREITGTDGDPDGMIGLR
jgi:hypothetical protein